MDESSYFSSNILCEEGTFIYFLHERSKFDEAAYNEFLEKSSTVLNNLKAGGPVDPRLIASVFTVHSLVLKYLVFHFDPNDGRLIDGITDEKYQEVLEGLNDVFYHKDFV